VNLVRINTARKKKERTAMNYLPGAVVYTIGWAIFFSFIKITSALFLGFKSPIIKK
jgi:hypothetical protein